MVWVDRLSRSKKKKLKKAHLRQERRSSDTGKTARGAAIGGGSPNRASAATPFSCGTPRERTRFFIEHNGGWLHVEGICQLLHRWDRAARHVAAWRLRQAALFGPNWMAVDEAGVEVDEGAS